jgi:Undecaprenyl-phosphate galactose phosphotransferase WbaP
MIGTPTESTRWLAFRARVVLPAVLVATDVFAVTISFFIAGSLRAYLGERGMLFDPLKPGLDFYFSYAPVVLLWPLVLWREGLYPGLWLTPEAELRRLIEGSTLASLLVISLTFVTRSGPEFSRPILVGWWIVALVLLPLHHVGAKLILSTAGVRGWPCVLIGANELSARILRGLRKQYIPAVDVLAVFRGPDEPAGQAIDDIPLAGDFEDGLRWGATHRVGTALLAIPGTSGTALVATVERLNQTYRRVLVVPDLQGISTAETDVRDLEGILSLEIRHNLLAPHSQLVKRSLDILFSILVGAILLPLIGLSLLTLALERNGPIFFGHQRLGKNGQPFVAWKFRTMVRDADKVLTEALARDPQAEQEWQRDQKLRRDPRMTPVGRMLRRFSLDEIPQLWNILLGEMSLVGPRPIVEEEVERYGPLFSVYTQVRPGLTGLWQVSGRSDLTYQERVRLDAYYVRNWSVWLDLVILLRTFLAVLTGRGAY